MSGARERDLVLAVYPFTRGIAFTLFEGPLSPIDWGVKDVRGSRKNAASLEVTKQLIERLQPDILVLLDLSRTSGRRSERIRRLQRLIEIHGLAQAIEVHRFTREDIRKCFKGAGAATRYEIAQTIASHVHALGHRLPPVRKIWKSEDARMGLFDAASLVMTFFCLGGESPQQAVEP